jgi:hypothetical protein
MRIGVRVSSSGKVFYSSSWVCGLGAGWAVNRAGLWEGGTGVFLAQGSSWQRVVLAFGWVCGEPKGSPLDIMTVAVRRLLLIAGSDMLLNIFVSDRSSTYDGVLD